jgi:HPt (histidine-containing phosphotransfer) domain-containing protein
MHTERFKQLAQKFLVRTRDELASLEQCLSKAQQGDADALLTLQHIAHRINGSGAMLGFRPVSEQAAQIEGILRRSNNAPDAQDWVNILSHVQKLAAALQTASADDPQDND